MERLAVTGLVIVISSAGASVDCLVPDQPDGWVLTSRMAASSIELSSVKTADRLKPPEVDIMVLYTDRAKRTYGDEQIHTKIALSIACMNEALQRSGVAGRLRLVYQAEATWYSEADLVTSDLHWLASDPLVAQWRDRMGADLVSLLVQNDRPSKGWAHPAGVYSVFNGGPRIFAHECGHNLGCRHDRAHAGDAAASTASNFGYSFTPPGSPVPYGDLMSYVGSAIDQFSNPEKFFQGSPTGIPYGQRDAQGRPMSADNASALRQNMPIVSQEKPSAVTTLQAVGLSPDQTQFTFEIRGPGTGLCTVEYTLDYSRWQHLTDVVLTGEGATLVDSVGDQSFRCYRARLDEDALINWIGFLKRQIEPGFSMMANPFHAPDNTIAGVLPVVSDGTQVFKWMEGLQRWESNSYASDWQDPAMTLYPGEGAFIHHPGPSPLRLGFAGELIRAFHNRVPLRYSIRSSAVPQAGRLSSDLGFAPFGEVLIYRMLPSGASVQHRWDGVQWEPEEPFLRMGEGFWCYNAANACLWQRVLATQRTTRLEPEQARGGQAGR